MIHFNRMVTLIPLFLGGLAGALPAQAQTAAESDVVPRLIDTGCFRLVAGLNGCEQVTLLTSQTDPDTADLLIYPDRRTNEASGPLLVLRDAVFNGAMWGMAPALEETPGGFRVRAEQSGIGRFPWFETLDVIHDGEAFVISAYSYSAYDRAWPRYLSCEVNFVTGAYRTEAERGNPEDENAEPVIAATAGTDAPARVLLRDWRVETQRPTRCSDAANAAFGND